MVPFNLEPILLKLEGGRYVSPILPLGLVDILADRKTGNRRGVGGAGRAERQRTGIGIGTGAITTKLSRLFFA